MTPVAETPKLSKAQAELLKAINKGVRVIWMSGLDSYYFRVDTQRRVTATALALVNRGLVKEIKGTPYKRGELVAKEPA